MYRTISKPYLSLLFCILMLFCVLPSVMAADQYRVTAKRLNVRYQPKKTAFKVATLPQGTVVTVLNTTSNGWAYIDYEGHTGYVSKNYLEYVPPQVADQSLSSKSKSSDDLAFLKEMLEDFSGKLSHHDQWPVYVVVLLSVIMLIFLVNSDEEWEEEVAVLFLGLFTLSSALIVYYFWGYKDDSTWFCSPNKVGWIMTIINFFLYAGVLFVHVLAFMRAMFVSDDLGDRRCPWFYCLIGLGVCLLSVIVGLFWPPMLFVGLIAFCLLQVVWPIYMVYCNIEDDGSWANLIFTYLLYLLAFVATLFLFVNFIMLLLVAAAIAVGLFIVGAILSADDDSWTSVYDSSGNHIGWIK